MRKLIISILCISLLGCDSNLFSESANRDTNEAIIFDAKYLMGLQEWTDAIDLLETLPADALAQDDVKSLLASAYAGRCGLNLIELALGVKDYASSSVFKVALADQSNDPGYTDCATAETLLEEVGADTERNDDQNLLMALTAIAKIGAILAAVADIDGDAAPDAGFDACPNVTFTDALVTEMAISYTHFAQSIRNMDTDAVGSSLKSALNTFCSSAPSMCDNYTAASVTATDISSLRTLTHSDASKIGLNTKDGTVCP